MAYSVQREEGDINKEERGRGGADIGNGKDDGGDLRANIISGEP